MSINVDNTRNYSGSGNDPGVQKNDGGDLNSLFMTLLVAQIQNQDPLNPTDGTEYVSQLAQMTQVQSMETMSQLMKNNSVLMDNLQVLSTAGLVGQSVMVQTDKVQLEDQPINGRITLGQSANTVNIIVKDSAGVERKVELGKQASGQVEFTIDPKELGLAPGEYSLSVVTDVGEKKVPLEVAGTVNNVRIPLEGGSALVNVSGLGEVPFYNVSQFGPNGKTSPDSSKQGV
ncbi:flagellar hook assembly protein FlgD [Pragia fontium]|uniref:Basal-body rod modification protein FlgD n=1 Tax=Pragia fontium TaxID=82985 RepID=A0ABQ5LH66_9GAMM|nr:flagellar hook assembly protein FlgD [Pragia fontium]AKJ41385.1 flagellar basal body rod modification protein [Pragia fontium]GKX62941.1 basal-body rod modification protein FlgD [Pragia fontium]SUB81634.1 Basal-body rod modification protein flgD [Pragia fontium]VEJ54106.1 Basal-body rod modification protein flgD [Pragia fontium]